MIAREALASPAPERDAAVYLVWSPEGETPPRIVHPTYHAAMTAARGMAKRIPGHSFYVVKTCSRPLRVAANEEPRVGCDGKVPHRTRDAAERQVANMQRMGNLSAKAGRRDMHSYICGNCGFWHVGSKAL